jgi:hypothetical protein
MQDRMEQFLGLSVELTGFDRLKLLATAMTGTYIDTMDARLPAGVLDELLAVYGQLPAGAGREAAITAQLLEDPKLGPVARNLILLWYCGTWTVLPEQWHAAYGGPRLDDSGVVSPDAYVAGLQWVAAGAHPAGARQQGFGAWSQAPESSAL